MWWFQVHDSGVGFEWKCQTAWHAEQGRVRWVCTLHLQFLSQKLAVLIWGVRHSRDKKRRQEGSWGCKNWEGKECKSSKIIADLEFVLGVARKKEEEKKGAYDKTFLDSFIIHSTNQVPALCSVLSAQYCASWCDKQWTRHTLPDLEELTVYWEGQSQSCIQGLLTCPGLLRKRETQLTRRVPVCPECIHMSSEWSCPEQKVLPLRGPQLQKLGSLEDCWQATVHGYFYQADLFVLDKNNDRMPYILSLSGIGILL